MNIRRFLLILISIIGMVQGGVLIAAPWTVNPYDYRYDMTIYMDCKIGSGVSDYSRYSIGAFVGDECRGIGELIQDDRLTSPVILMRVYSNVTSGEKVTFKAYNSQLDSTYPSQESVEFKSDEVIGLPSSSYMVNFSVAPTSLSLSDQSIALFIGESKTVIATVNPPMTNDKTVTWSSSDTNIASVENGVIMAKGKGSANVIAKCGTLTASCEVTVTPPQPTAITLNQTSATIAIGDNLQLSTTLTPSYAESAVEWSIDNSGVATVSETGLVTAIAKGTATITVTTSNGKTATCTVTVNAPEPTAVALNKTTETLVIGETSQLSATLTPSNAETTLTWKSSDTKVATVNSEGLVTALEEGTAIITVTTTNGKSASCEIIVEKKDEPIEPEPILPESMELSETSITLNIGESHQLYASIYPQDADYTLTWSSAHEGIAVVTEKGLITAISEGITTITASTDNGLTATCEILVSADAGVEDIFDESQTISVYSINGVLLKTKVEKDYLKTLDRGTFIIRQGSSSKKIIK